MYLYNNNCFVRAISEPLAWNLGCLKNTKSLKSQAPQGFSGCLDIENDEMNKKIFLSASLRVKQTLRSSLYFRMKWLIMKKNVLA